jgi:hypothetical protein
MPEPWEFEKRAVAGEPATEPSRVVVKVSTPGYVPAGFDLRTRIDETMFTADAWPADLAAAEADPQVESVDRGRDLQAP